MIFLFFTQKPLDDVIMFTETHSEQRNAKTKKERRKREEEGRVCVWPRQRGGLVMCETLLGSNKMLTRSVSIDQLSYTAPIIPFDTEKGTEVNLVNRTLYVANIPQVSSSNFFLRDQISSLGCSLVVHSGEGLENEIEMGISAENDNDGLMDVDEPEGNEHSLNTSLESSSRQFSIEALPLEILTQIFRYLDTKSFTRAAGVCLTWRQLAASPWLWWNRCNVVWDHLLHISQRSSHVCNEILASQLYEYRLLLLTQKSS
jgi:hypothetical protein